MSKRPDFRERIINYTKKHAESLDEDINSIHLVYRVRQNFRQNWKIPRSTTTRFFLENDGNIILEQVRLLLRNDCSTMIGSRINLDWRVIYFLIEIISRGHSVVRNDFDSHFSNGWRSVVVPTVDSSSTWREWTDIWTCLMCYCCRVDIRQHHSWFLSCFGLWDQIVEHFGDNLWVQCLENDDRPSPTHMSQGILKSWLVLWDIVSRVNTLRQYRHEHDYSDCSVRFESHDGHVAYNIQLRDILSLPRREDDYSECHEGAPLLRRDPRHDYGNWFEEE